MAELTACLAESTALAEEGFAKIRKISRGLRETSDKVDQIYQELLHRFETSKAKDEVRKIQERILEGRIAFERSERASDCGVGRQATPFP